MVDLIEEISPKLGQLEVCIDDLESAINAIHGGAHELELCSSLAEGGLTPSPGLVSEIIDMVNNIKSGRRLCSDCDELCNCQNVKHVPKLNVMIRCRGGADFCYTEKEMQTMISDLKIYKKMGVDRFVFGALTNKQDVNSVKCSQIIKEAVPIPVTFHRAFDLCLNPPVAIKTIINLGFTRLLTSGQKLSAADDNAVELLKKLHKDFGNEIEIMPGSGINLKNVMTFINMGFKIVHSSCKVEKDTVKVKNDLAMGSSTIYVTDEKIVQSMVEIINVK